MMDIGFELLKIRPFIDFMKSAADALEAILISFSPQHLGHTDYYYYYYHGCATVLDCCKAFVKPFTKEIEMSAHL